MTIHSPSLPPDALSRSPALEELARETLQCLQAALLDALLAAGVDPLRPRHAARQLGLDKTLMWRVSRIVGQPDVFQTLASVPHQAGFNLLCRAFKEAGVPPSDVDELGRSVLAFDELVKRHAGDRATFELLAAGFGRAEHQSQSFEQGRKLAYRGNSAVWGAQARLQLATTIMLPGATDPALVDLVRVAGFVGLQRLRSDVRWTLLHEQSFDDSLLQVRCGRGSPLDSAARGAHASLVEEFSSEDFPALSTEIRQGEQRHVLEAGMPGRTGELTAIFAHVYRSIGSRYASATETFCQLMVSLLTPVEHLQLDVLVHEDLEWAFDPHIAILGALDGRPERLGESRNGQNPPFTETVRDLGRGLQRASTPHMPRYESLLGWALRQLAVDPARFRTYRFDMSFPPMPARAVLYCELLPPDADDHLPQAGVQPAVGA